MGDNVIIKSVGLVLITAHTILYGLSHAEVTGILGSNITLHFKFNDTIIHPNNFFTVYTTGQRKIAHCSKSNICSGGGFYHVYPENTSVVYHITNLSLNDSEIYWISFIEGGAPKESNRVQLVVQEDNRTSTVPPLLTNAPVEYDGTLFPFHIVIMVVLPLLLLASVLSWLIWCLVRTEDKHQQPRQQNSNPTLQETIEDCSGVPPPTLVYSVLDFPKRPSAVLEMNPNDTEYAAVSYLPDSRV